MIVADSQKILFVHIYKTGGSSITCFLMPHITENFRSKQPKTSGSRWQKTWHIDRSQHSKFAEALPVLDKFNLDLDNYFKFVFVRNPYSWILSIWNNFYQSPKRNLPNSLRSSVSFMFREIFNNKLDSQYFYKMHPDGSFKSFVLFIDEVVTNHPQSAQKVWGATEQYSFIENDRNIEFDFIGRFENFEEDLNKISNKIDAKQLSEIPKKVVSASKNDRQDYLKYYDKQSIEIINRIFARDFKTFNYKPID